MGAMSHGLGEHRLDRSNPATADLADEGCETQKAVSYLEWVSRLWTLRAPPEGARPTVS